MKQQKTGNNYSTFSRNVQLKIDDFFAEKIIPENDSVRLLEEITETIKEPLERVFKRTGRNYGTSPKIMLNIILYAAMEKVYSSRDIEERCKRDINYIWLLSWLLSSAINAFLPSALAASASSADISPALPVL